MSDKPGGSTSLITNPAIVKSALGAKKHQHQHQQNQNSTSASAGSPKPKGDKKNAKSKSNSKPRSATPDEAASADSSKNSNNSTGPKKSKQAAASAAASDSSKPKPEGLDKKRQDPSAPKSKQDGGSKEKSKQTKASQRNNGQKGAAAATPDKQENGHNRKPSVEDLRKVLFPDIFGEGGSMATPNSSKNRPPKFDPATANSSNGSGDLSSSPGTSGSSFFSGSSFHSSPAPSALPRPSFKKSAPPALSAQSAMPPVSMLDQFMMADRQEREQMKRNQESPAKSFTTSPVSNNSALQHPSPPMMYQQPGASPVRQPIGLAQQHGPIPGMNVPHFPHPPANAMMPPNIGFNYPHFAPMPGGFPMPNGSGHMAGPGVHAMPNGIPGGPVGPGPVPVPGPMGVPMPGPYYPMTTSTSHPGVVPPQMQMNHPLAVEKR